MKNKIVTSLIIALGLASVALADSIKITRNQASEIYVALAQLESGLEPTNAVIAADNINALRPHVEALDKGRAAADRSIGKIAGAVRVIGGFQFKTPEGESAAQGVREALEAKGEELVEVQVTRFEISNDEIKAAKIRPLQLSTFRQFLKPNKSTP